MERFGIIDIGSNSIRLVIYEQTEHGAYRIIDQAKDTARLSDRIDDSGNLSPHDFHSICTLLQRYAKLCHIHQTKYIRTVATAALRNAAQGTHIIQLLKDKTQLPIELLSGEEEARIGLIGVLNTMDLDRGFVIDLGGGSTELTLFRDREIVDTISIPLGAVNALRLFGKSDRTMTTEQNEALVDALHQALRDHPWVHESPYYPCIGLGGTVRGLCKMDQRKRNYSLPLMHQYSLSPTEVGQWLHHIQPLTVEQRKRIDGLTKDRADIIVTGLTILHTLLKITHANQLVVSGAGLRDGLFFEALRPNTPPVRDVLNKSVENVLKLYNASSEPHVRYVHRIGLRLFHLLQGEHGLNDRMGITFGVACMLYRIGVAVDFYNFEQHTYYLIAHSRLDGLSHRELLLCAMIASFRNEKRTKPLYAQHKDILASTDPMLVSRLGSLLQLASALDRSETQPITDIHAHIVGRQLTLTIQSKHTSAWELEYQQVQAFRKEFEKIWGLQLKIIAG